MPWCLTPGCVEMSLLCDQVTTLIRLSSCGLAVLRLVLPRRLSVLAVVRPTAYCLALVQSSPVRFGIPLFSSSSLPLSAKPYALQHSPTSSGIPGDAKEPSMADGVVSIVVFEVVPPKVRPTCQYALG